MDLSEYLAALRKRWAVIVALALIGALAAFAYARSTPPSYTATAKVYVSLNNGETTSDLLQGSAFVKNLIDSYAALADMPVVLDAVAQDVGIDGPGRSLAGTVTANALLNTSIIEISVVDGSAERSAAIANSVATNLSETVERLSPTSESGGDSVSLDVVSEATVPAWPSAPRTKFLVATGGFVGLALGLVTALLWSALDTRIRTQRDIEALIADGTAILGSIPRSRRRGAPLAVVDDPLSATAEAYRKIQTNLSYIDVADPARAFVVTSSVPGEGKSTTARNIALTLAEGTRRVLLLDADLRRPSVSESFGLESSAGLTTVLLGRAGIDDVVQSVGVKNLDVLPSGPLPPNPHQLIESSAMRGLLKAAREAYDVVVIDTPPLLPVSDAAVLATMADGTILVVGGKRVRRQQLRQSLRSLSAVGGRILGVVMTFAPRSGLDGEFYGYRNERRGFTFPRPSRRRPERDDEGDALGSTSDPEPDETTRPTRARAS
ncbi:polysaccharide biosynthesis tyrosine autokinase [Cellulosimicrobium terreum]|nr:polysaccharide biosynthesis tyrosine autokinase [Cellulosimicrobium terreum]